ncbi:MAG: AmmeMemoRadiSam system protein B [Ignavibacteria bacterium RIFCSPLOWO2_02_FULL_55_14]|nr:MAG: AmmeMemoRadiSam system protein B [Ignavibacteria bacterium RIFCSPLOWO2_02_FULL_55_14]
MTPSRSVRPPAVAGLFYTSNARALRREVETMLDAAAEHTKGSGEGLSAVIAPHAGYMYSGFTAACSFNALSKREFDTAVLIGPSHRELIKGLNVFPGDAYATPLGEMDVDKDLAAALVKKGHGLVDSVAGHRTEHALEVQVPFLQCIRPGARIVAITMGDQGAEACENLAEALAETMRGRNAVLIASSDLSHYHPYDEAVKIDSLLVDKVNLFRPKDLILLLETEAVEACGGGPIVAVMLAASLLGANAAHVLRYCNSGDITGDKSAVVGYMAAVLGTK